METSQGVVVEQLLESGVTVYPVSPVSAKRYRERKVPSGNKTDHAGCLEAGRRLARGRPWLESPGQEDPLMAELRLLCRDEVALIEERTALINQLQSALHEYYPAALEAFEDWTLPSAWAFVEAFPTPAGPTSGRQAQVGKVPAHPQAGPAADLCKTAWRSSPAPASSSPGKR